METYRVRRVLRADRGGSSWPVLIETDAGVFHTKLRGAAQAPASLVAEIIVGALADALGLSVPARVLIDIPSDVPVDDPHQELGELLHRSVGRNLGFQYMSDVRGFHPEFGFSNAEGSWRDLREVSERPRLGRPDLAEWAWENVAAYGWMSEGCPVVR